MSKKDYELKEQELQQEIQKDQKKKTKGQSLVEYGLILALVSVVAIAVLQTMGGEIKKTVNQVSNQLKQANQAAQNAAASTSP